MKQIKLKDGITLMAVEVDEPDKEYFIPVQDFCGENDNWLAYKRFKDDREGTAILGLPRGDLQFLGTAPELLAREDAEDVCRKWVVSLTSLELNGGWWSGNGADKRWYKSYANTIGCICYGQYAKQSFQSALSAMGYVDGEILIIKVEGEGK